MNYLANKNDKLSKLRCYVKVILGRKVRSFEGSSAGYVVFEL